MKKVCRLLLLLLVSSMPTHAEEFGRFFSTPEQRKILDQRRDNAATTEQTVEATVVVEEATPDTVGAIALHGLMYRGKRNKGIVWINDANAKQLLMQEAAVSGNRASVTLSGEGRAYQLEVGQKLVPEPEAEQNQETQLAP
ncbi:MAG: hypothetical protein ACR2P9_02385 [Gammaproteobacteria bacterium]